MGLDMYMYIKKGVYEDPDKVKERVFDPELEVFENNLRARGCCLGKTTTFEIGYWRKANAIHNWIVNNCADGVDECQMIYIPLEKAEELRDVCNQVLADHSKAPELLPTTDGFFFGDTDYDDWYFNKVQYTADLLTMIILWMKEREKKVEEGTGDGAWYEIYYQASW